MIPEIKNSTTQPEGCFRLPSSVSCFGDHRLLDVFFRRMKGIPQFSDLIFDSECECETDSVIVLQPAELFSASAADESYTLTITSRQAAIQASSDAGFAFGLTTLFHLLWEGKGICACQIIQDAPLYSYRGFHLDCSRHFFDVDTVLLMIEMASLLKMNRMHWHISDDQGYRLESRAFPLLNKIASWRTEPDGSIHGGFYTMDQVREIVDFAAARGMEIIPEIDLPGHVSAIIAAYPDLSCSEEPLTISFMGGIYPRILCGGKDKTLQFVFRLLDEIVPLFPSVYFHIGGDEAPKEEWKKCPHCQAKIKALGLSGEEELQAHFSSQIAKYLKKLGKKAICWNDALKASSFPEDICIQYWDEEGEDPAYCRRYAASPDRSWIYSFTPAFYFDYIPALTPMRKTYRFEPVLRSGLFLDDSRLLGIECTLWSEQFSTRQELLDLAFPRMFAVAERGWTQKQDYGEFLLRCRRERDLFLSLGVTIPSVSDADPVGEHQKELILQKWGPLLQRARAAGMENVVPVICGLIRSKTADQFPPQELEELIQQLKGE